MSIRHTLVASIIAALLTTTLSAQTDPFTVDTPLTAQGVFSCTDLTVSSGVIDSSGLANAGPANRALLRSNGNVWRAYRKSSGPRLDSDAAQSQLLSVTAFVSRDTPCCDAPHRAWLNLKTSSDRIGMRTHCSSGSAPTPMIVGMPLL
jgi:hypothetical protein